VENPEERPARSIFISALLLDRHEVTNGQFARFVAETGHRTDAEKAGKAYTLAGDSWGDVAGADWRHPQGPASSIEGMETHPVVLVSWNDAKAYAGWAGRRLPTEAEFEKALRGGLEGMTWPWGKDATPKGKPGNYSDGTGRSRHRSWVIVPGYSDEFERSSPAGSFDQNALGLFDVGGNVWEWCADWFDRSAYGASPDRDPQGPAAGTLRVVRGGGWFGAPAYVRAAYRDRKDPGEPDVVRGFRLGTDL
jgi:sulfatase modifying factor 1